MPNLTPLELLAHQNLLFAHEGGDIGGAIFSAFLLILGGTFCVFLIIQITTCICLNDNLQIIPKEYHQTSSGRIWLLMIPFFHVLWNFAVFPQISNSLRKCAEAKRNQTLDCGEALAWLICCSNIAYPILLFLFWPLGILVGLLSLLFLIIYLLKVNHVSNLLKNNADGPSSD
ncbi:MAG: hypothetical protein PVH19_09380 [Planctomycetia bacterium]|jgi:hypothetical protein